MRSASQNHRPGNLHPQEAAGRDTPISAVAHGARRLVRVLLLVFNVLERRGGGCRGRHAKLPTLSSTQPSRRSILEVKCRGPCQSQIGSRRRAGLNAPEWPPRWGHEYQIQCAVHAPRDDRMPTSADKVDHE